MSIITPQLLPNNSLTMSLPKLANPLLEVLSPLLAAAFQSLSHATLASTTPCVFLATALQAAHLLAHDVPASLPQDERRPRRRQSIGRDGRYYSRDEISAGRPDRRSRRDAASESLINIGELGRGRSVATSAIEIAPERLYKIAKPAPMSNPLATRVGPSVDQGSPNFGFS